MVKFLGEIFITIATSFLPHREPTPNIVYHSILRNGIENPKYVLAQSVLETAWYSSYNCQERNNLFGMRCSLWKEKGNSNGYKIFDDWEESVTYYRDWQKRKGYKSGEDYLSFLDRIGYAEDPEYGWKLESVLKRLETEYGI
jgi:flagellum-specific peptidoglycan hydrolase FlgJ